MELPVTIPGPLHEYPPPPDPVNVIVFEEQVNVEGGVIAAVGVVFTVTSVEAVFGHWH